MSFIRLIIWLILFYFLYKLAKNILKYFVQESTPKNIVKRPKKNNLKIDKNDIIDAKFEEIKSNDKDKAEEKN